MEFYVANCTELLISQIEKYISDSTLRTVNDVIAVTLLKHPVQQVVINVLMIKHLN